MFRDLLKSWPAFRQLTTGGDGTGVKAMSAEGARHAVSLTSPTQRASRFTLFSIVDGSTLVKHRRSSESPAGSG
jgi:hypothetical protein